MVRRFSAGFCATLLAFSPIAAFAQYAPGPGPAPPITTPVSPANGGSGVANTGNLTWNAAQTLSFTSGQTMTLPAATTTLAGLGTTQTFSAANTLSLSPAVSTSAMAFTGSPQTGGSTTSNFPVLYMNNGTAPTTWIAGGTYFGLNGSSGFAGNFIDVHANGGASIFSVGPGGGTTVSGLSLPSTGIINFSTRMFLNAPANGSFQWGTDAAAPVAQTLQPANVVAGTSNTAGQTFTFAGSRGTGTGAGGSVVIETAPATTTGSIQNPEVIGWTLDQATHQIDGGTAPTCGTGCTSVNANSVDNAFAVVSSSAVTAVTVNFGKTWAAAPVACTVSTNLAVPLATAITALSATAITITTASAITSATLYVICR